MPYIPEPERERIRTATVALANTLRGEPVGAWNYAITVLLLERLAHTGTTYTHLNELHGLLACVNAELYRRMTAPYESAKAKENGDVFPYKEGDQ